MERQQVAAALVDVMGALADAGRTGVSMDRDGDPKHAILTVAKERRSDLIVMGTGGVGGFRGGIRGSVWCEVSKTATCSTLVVATRQDPIVGAESTSHAWASDSSG